MLKSIHRLITLLLIVLFVSSPLLAQQRRNAPPRKPAVAETPEPMPTFDSLLAAESYKVYCEVRGVGGLIRSPAVNDLLDPVMKLGRPPKELKTVVKWINAHAEILAGSRMMVAGWASRPKLPTVLIAIEFSSSEEAKKFYPELRDFLPTLLPTPTPTPDPAPSPTPTPKRAAMSGDSTNAGLPQANITAVPPKASHELRPVAEPQPPPVLPYQMRQVGSLVLISDTTFTLRDLRPRGSKPLEEDQNFILARNRFASESLFLYVDVKSIETEEKSRQQKWEEEEQKRIEAEAANPPKVEEKMAEEAELTAPAEEDQPPPAPEPSVSAELVLEEAPPASARGTLSAEPQSATAEAGPMFVSLYSALFGGESKWPEAVSAALVLEGDAYVVRTLVINGPENKGLAIPFAPQFVSGPPIVPESPNIFPADTNLFVSVSLDYPQIYEGMLKALANAEARAKKNLGGVLNEGPPPESPFAFYEKKLGLKIKDDLLPLLGNELALALPKKAPSPSPTLTNPGAEKTTADSGEQQTTKSADPTPVIAIAVKDREAVARLIPKLIEGLGFKGASLLAQTEKKDGTEITSYAGVFSYAFIGDFLIVSPDAAETRRTVDAYLNHQTLSSDSHFRNFTHWQPRQVLGQVYVGPDLMETYNPFSRGMGGSVNARTNDYLSRLSPLIEPTTYVLSNDGSGPLHELHIPRNLLLWMIGSSMVAAEASPLRGDEAAAQSLLRTVHSAEMTFQATTGNGRYGNLAELVAANLVIKESLTRSGYSIEVSASDDKFEAIAVPVEYRITGTLSYFIDESGVLRAGDHAGAAATASDQPVE
ncbi:MAG TPA: DUF3352 domain-containing protein [Pyrinomonadaceae bacterium]|jgi:hypothetical protein|nr:DUF3352 domain-containing protein [Pyrinomonadaceae bacterium]